MTNTRTTTALHFGASLATTLALGVAAFTFAMPAHAAAAKSAPLGEVRFGDLDFASAKDRATLADRINTAAAYVCRDGVVTSSPAQAKLAYDSCLDEVRGDVQERIAAKASDRHLARR